ncbi:MAG: LysM peptidoglycan-binding domain-containing protein [Bacteroidales bacterium]|nr:LysM peptidoglycan-binding domain-containing protein [Bacteroidales bacterium]MDZ4205346.1 LysM peptidoglycan-binding domain-containing protein [Bacteroidales bacterium]
MFKIFTLFLLCFTLTLQAQEVVPFEDSLLYIEELYPGDSIQEGDTISRGDFLHAGPISDMLDSLYRSTLFGNNGFEIRADLKNKYGFSPDYIPAYPDSIHFERMSRISRQTPIELTYNWQVKEFIELYAGRRRNLTNRMLGLAELYFPVFEEHLDRLGLPLELKYLAVVESALLPTARSRAGATGLWQFMYGTGKMYNLRVTSLVDDRSDPYSSTIAAAEHLRDLFNLYNDWQLALAAYNSGAGNVNRAIRRSGGKRNFWEISPFLPKETRGYVPAFIAVTYVMSYPEEHNLYPVKPAFLHHEIDTVAVKDVLSFDQISENLNIPMDQLRFLNPSFRHGIIPSSAEKIYYIRLPEQYIAPFIESERELYTYKTQKGIEREQLLAQMKEIREQQYHRVRSGETLGAISKRYKCSINDLKYWNNLKSNSLRIGQRLVVVPGSGYIAPIVASSSASKPSSSLYHNVRSGETLAAIASKYKCSVSDLRNWNNLTSDIIKINQRLVVSNHVKPKTSVTTTPSAGAALNQKFIYYTVQKGDTLWEIANKHKGATVEQIKQWNNLGGNSKIQPGQKLKVGLSG